MAANGIRTLTLALAPLLLWAGGEPATTVSSKAEPKIRGMTISCRGDGVEWASDATVQSMETLKELGVNWVCIHPYAGIRQDGEVFLWRRLNLDVPPAWLTRPIAEAHRLGLKIMIKPHIGYWGSGFSWRGAIEFQTEEAWARFFRTYRVWISRVAEICRDADALVVGTELDRTIHYTDEWRDVIRAVREQYDGPLTYAANWSDYRRVKFWKDLDTIGIQAYFPLLDPPRGETRKAAPSADELDAGWRRVMEELRSFSDQVGKKIVFTELGYNLSFLAPYKPWDHNTHGPSAEPFQARCLSAALRAIDNEDSVCAVFLWKWFPGDRPARNFAKSTPAMRRVIREWWRAGEK